MSLKRKLQ